MKSILLVPAILALTIFQLHNSCLAQQLTVDGEAVVGAPGEGNSILTLTSERSWSFKQFGSGPSTALELTDLTGQKNFIFNTTGNVGIGVHFPTDKLQVNGNIRAMGNRIGFGSSEYIEDGGGFIIKVNGALISTVDGADDLGSAAFRWRNVYATGGTINTSDGRMKTNVGDLKYGLKDIMQLRPVSFVWKAGPGTDVRLGLIAQEVKEVIKEVIADHEFVRNETHDGWDRVESPTLGLYYSDLIPVLIKAIQEQQKLIDDKELRIAELEARVQHDKNLEQRLERLEKLMVQTSQDKTLIYQELH